MTTSFAHLVYRKHIVTWITGLRPWLLCSMEQQQSLRPPRCSAEQIVNQALLWRLCSANPYSAADVGPRPPPWLCPALPAPRRLRGRGGCRLPFPPRGGLLCVWGPSAGLPGAVPRRPFARRPGRGVAGTLVPREAASGPRLPRFVKNGQIRSAESTGRRVLRESSPSSAQTQRPEVCHEGNQASCGKWCTRISSPSTLYITNIA